jgi:hypothetical protein
VLSSVVSYFAGSNLRGTQAIVNRIAMVQVHPGSERARVDGVIGLLPPRRGTYTVSVADNFALWSLGDRSGAVLPGDTGTTIAQGVNNQVQDVPADAGTTVAFSTTGYTTATPIEGNATMEILPGETDNRTNLRRMAARVTGTVTNTTGQTLYNAVALASGGVTDLGTLEAGATREFSFDLELDIMAAAAFGNVQLDIASARYGSVTNFSNVATTTVRQIMSSTGSRLSQRGIDNSFERQEYVRREQFLNSIAFDTDPTGGRGTDVYIAGWTDNSPLNVDLNGASFITEDTTLYVYRLPVTLANVGDLVELGGGLLTWTTTDRSSRRDVAPYFLQLQPGEEIVFRYQPLLPLDGASEIRVSTRTGGYGGRDDATISLWDWSAQEWVPIQDFEDNEARITDAERFINPIGAVELLDV